MKTCKDCTHYELCQYNEQQQAMYFGKDKKIYITIKNNIPCKFFKDNVVFGCDLSIASIKAEAIKEFAERLKEKAYRPNPYPYIEILTKEDIDNLVKEMVGEE